MNVQKSEKINTTRITGYINVPLIMSKEAFSMENQSSYDPNRKTIGAIYRDSAATAKEGDFVEAGDLSRELMKSLVDDLNDSIASNPYGNNPFYITIHESKDLMMPRAIRRRMINTRYRPFPEDDTVVFYVEPETNLVEFCWELPHRTVMYNRINNEWLYEKEEVTQIKAYLNEDYWHFGFCKDEMGNWKPNPHFKDKKLEVPKAKVHQSNLFLPIGF